MKRVLMLAVIFVILFSCFTAAEEARTWDIKYGYEFIEGTLPYKYRAPEIKLDGLNYEVTILGLDDDVYAKEMGALEEVEGDQSITLCWKIVGKIKKCKIIFTLSEVKPTNTTQAPPETTIEPTETPVQTSSETVAPTQTPVQTSSEKSFDIEELPKTGERDWFVFTLGMVLIYVGILAWIVFKR
jgi:LPXTG-motif cell wall-anchored protein